MWEMSGKTKKHLMQLIAFAIVLYCGIEHLDVVIDILGFICGIAAPFFVGGAMAFIFNVPMKHIEKHIFAKNKKYQKWRRPLAYILTLVCFVGVIVLVMVVVIPELTNTIALLATQIPKAFKELQVWLEEVPERWPALEPAIRDLDIDWSSISKSVMEFLQSIASGVLSSGVGIFSGIVNGVTTFVIALPFSIYLLFQKEKLARQARQIMYALLPDKATEKILEIARLSNQVFSNFLSGQCVEAIILGTLFVITMTILGMPYAMLIGMVIAVTALIPVFGAFIGCVVGMLLIVMVDPIQALWFLVLFLVLQQIEGNLIYPHVVGSSVGLPSIWVLVAVTIGGSLFGILGMFVFIPICSVLYALFRSFVKNRLKQRKVPESKWNS